MNPSPTPTLPGFEITGPIGRGGMGEVFAAVRLGPDGFKKQVALKRMLFDPASDERARQRFLREAKVAARLDHPNVVSVHDLVMGDDGYFIVMERLTGASLDALLRANRGETPPWWLVLEVARQTLAGLHYVHALSDEQGRPLEVVHRDITPKNLFVCETGVVKILDFGVVQIGGASGARKLTESGVVHGTPSYLSPELARGDADRRSDLFQLGAVMYTALVGEPPYGTGGVGQILTRAVLGEIIPVETRRPDLPREVTALIERALASEPDARYPTAAAMADAVAAAMRNGPTANPTELARWARGRLPSFSAASEADEALATAEPETASVPVARERLPRRLAGTAWTLESELGSGGMARVYRGRRDDGRVAALKVLRPAFIATAELRERFFREADAPNRLEHPALARVLERNVVEGTAYIAFELLEGEDLEARVRRRGPLPVAEAVGHARALLEVLAHAHARGALHRDVKPANVFITAGGELKLLDFGLVRLTDALDPELLTREGTLLGSLAYMSPEQARGEISRLDARTDVFAVGATLFHLLAGRPPRRATQGPTWIAKAATEPVPPLASAAPDVPKSVAAAVDRALEFQPERRFPDAGAFLATLAALQGGEDIGPNGTVLAPPPPEVMAQPVALPLAPPPGPRRLQRKTRLGIGIGALAAAFGLVAASLAGLAFLWFQWGPDSEAPAKLLRISLSQLLKEYQLNAAVADQRYKGNWVETDGTLTVVQRTKDGALYVGLTDNKVLLVTELVCWLPRERDVAPFAQGQHRVVRGKVKGKGRAVELEFCDVVR